MNYKSIYISIKNIIIIKIKLQNHQKSIFLLNIYNSINNNLINILKQEIYQYIKIHDYKIILIKKDFNLYYSI